jgi:RNA polymerase sigma-70 factor, ECF subfamily
MTEQGWLAEQFEQNRPHLQAVAYGMLGSVSEAQDAVQEAWLRLGHSDTGAIDDLRAWLTTVVGRISLDMLRSRKARLEYATGSWLPEPLVGTHDDPVAVIGFTVVGGRIAELNLVADPGKLRHLMIEP